jgi:hypothetical protein
MGVVDNSGADKLRQDILRIRVTGEGASGIVYAGLYVPTLRLVAVKEQKVRERPV